MDDLTNITSENYLQAIVALAARLKRVEQRLAQYEAENPRLALLEPKESPTAEPPVPKLSGEDESKRFNHLKHLWLPYIERHMKEEKGLFLDGSSARSILSKMFQANHNEENIMNHMEHRKLIKWVTSSLKAWRRKDLLRMLKASFTQIMAANYGADNKDWPLDAIAREAMNFIDSEVIFKNDLAPGHLEGVSVLKEDLLAPSYRRFITTIVHNLVPREANAFLPEYLQRKSDGRQGIVENVDIDPAEEEEDNGGSPEDENHTPIEMNEVALIDDVEPRKRTGKRKGRDVDYDTDDVEAKRPRGTTRRN